MDSGVSPYREGMRIDLHTHSRVSDGTDTPAELITVAKRAGLDVVALTDHDTAGGWAEAEEAARHEGMTLVRGMEISCARDQGSVHLLGYLPDPDHPELVEELQHAREGRIPRMRRMVERLSTDGYPVTMEQVLDIAGDGSTLGRPHLADALVANGVVADRQEAFDRFLFKNGPYYVTHYTPDPVRGVEIVRAAGGVPVVAHPFAPERGKPASESLLEEMAAAGLAGIEVRHREQNADAQKRLVEIADQLGLFITGSSDYHGTGKVNRIGENTTDPEVFAQIEDLASGVGVIRP